MKKLMYLVLAFTLLTATASVAQTPEKKEQKKECCDHSKTAKKDHKGCASDKKAMNGQTKKHECCSDKAKKDSKDKSCCSDKKAKDAKKVAKGCCSEKKA